MRLKVELWKGTAEYKQLGPNARNQVERWMLEKEITASHIEIFLDRLLDRFEVLNENQRVPFYETAHEKYKFK